MTKKIRNPIPLGLLRGVGVRGASDNFPELDDFQVTEISFQLVTGTRAWVCYADMDPGLKDQALRVLSSISESFSVRLESGRRELILGDFGISLPSDKEIVLVTAKF